MADARVVSNHLVDLASQRNNTLTPMQVLKLAYIAHGFSLGFRGTPLISNRVEAWKFGPVIPDLYQAIRHWRDRPVEKVDIEGLEGFGPGDAELVEQVYDAYQQYSGITLSSMTHQTGTPWDRVYNPLTNYIQIPNDLIREHYSQLLAASA